MSALATIWNEKGFDFEDDFLAFLDPRPTSGDAAKNDEESEAADMLLERFFCVVQVGDVSIFFSALFLVPSTD